ncbi:hypothetical protein WN943_008458 [Citrus x changshan-huyou]
MDELPQIATATRWVGCPVYVDSGEGPHSSWKDLICGKRLGQLSSLIGIKVSGDLVAWVLPAWNFLVATMPHSEPEAQQASFRVLTATAYSYIPETIIDICKCLNTLKLT